MNWVALTAALGLSACTLLFDTTQEVAGSDGGPSIDGAAVDPDAVPPRPDASMCNMPDDCDDGLECLDGWCVCPSGTEVGSDGSCVVSIVGNVAERQDSLRWSDGSRPTNCLGYLEGSSGYASSSTSGFYEISIGTKLSSVYCDMNPSMALHGRDSTQPPLLHWQPA